MAISYCLPAYRYQYVFFFIVDWARAFSIKINLWENRLLDSGFIIEKLSFYSLSLKWKQKLFMNFRRASRCHLHIPLKMAAKCSLKILEQFLFSFKTQWIERQFSIQDDRRYRRSCCCDTKWKVCTQTTILLRQLVVVLFWGVFGWLIQVSSCKWLKPNLAWPARLYMRVIILTVLAEF